MYNEDGVGIFSSLYFLIKGESMEVERRIRKIGNSMGVLIPADIKKALNLNEGDTVYVSMESEGEIVIRTKAAKNENDEFKRKVIAVLEEYLDDKEK